MYDRIKHLLSTELLYHRKQLWWWFGFLIFGLLYIGLRDHRPKASYGVGLPLQDEFALILWLMIIAHAYLTYKFITSSKIELRSYFLLSLPFNRSDIGLSRLFYVLLIHGIAFVILVGFIFLLMEPTQMHGIGRFITGKAFEVKGVIFFATVVILCLSYCVSVSIFLLESRRQRPLLSTRQWLLLASVLLLIIIPLFSVRFLFLSRSRVSAGFMLTTLAPVMGLLAVILSTWYHRRITHLTSWRE